LLKSSLLLDKRSLCILGQSREADKRPKNDNKPNPGMEKETYIWRGTEPSQMPLFPQKILFSSFYTKHPETNGIDFFLLYGRLE
jgi:hypothetical protein